MEDNLRRHATGDGQVRHTVLGNGAQALKCAQVFNGESIQQYIAVLVQDGRVIGLVASTDVPSHFNVHHLNHALLAPAYIDIQIYGAHKKLFATYPTTESLSLLHHYCLHGGATMHLPTVATNSAQVVERCIKAVRDYWAGGGEGVYGLHLEGPWINPLRRGAHVQSWITKLSLDDARNLVRTGKDVVKMITLAPECCPADVIRYLQDEGIIISAGHTNASFEEATTAFNQGINAVTHLYNAMSPLQHRAPGVVGAALLHPQVAASVIPDGHHVSWEAVRIAKQMMGNRLFCITDAVTETNKGPYQHYLAADKYECNGTLSGSALTMHQCVTNLVTHAGVTLEEALRMCSLYPATVLGLHPQRGRIAAGCYAHFVVLHNGLLEEVISGPLQK